VATATGLKNTTCSPARILAVPAITAADRSPARGSRDNGQITSASRTAAITPAGRSPSPARTLGDGDAAG
jgi:hypothetical protein